MKDFLERIARTFEDRPLAKGLVLAVLAMAALGLLLHLLLSSRGRGSPGARRLFREFAEASGLTAAETRLLYRVAADAGLDSPALIFVRPSVFDVAAPERGLEGARAESIRRKVYSP